MYTYSTPNQTEIHDTIKHMRSNAAPGPDGLSAAFYKSTQPWAKDDIYKVVADLFSHAHLPANINQTFLTSIPKKNQRHIGLFNVIYKIIAKSLAN